MSVPDRSRVAYGRFAEDLAARWYEARGFEITARNWRGRHGELDVVAARPGLLVVCEVKARRTDAFGTGAEAVTALKQQRLRRTAGQYLASLPHGVSVVRFDVAVVHGARLTVIEDAF